MVSTPPPPQIRRWERGLGDLPRPLSAPICKQRPALPGLPLPHTRGDRVFGHSETLTQPPLFSRLNEGTAKTSLAR